jgi:hypothetical protein
MLPVRYNLIIYIIYIYIEREREREREISACAGGLECLYRIPCESLRGDEEGTQSQMRR